MPTLYYTDNYLKALVSDDIETRAMDDVSVLGQFSDQWFERLAVLRAYIIACNENVKSDGDIFMSKADLYSKEFNSTLSRAKAAMAATSGKSPMVLSISIERA